MKTCKSCGAEFEETNAFCPECGARHGAQTDPAGGQAAAQVGPRVATVEPAQGPGSGGQAGAAGWLGTIVAAAGLLVSLALSAIIGLGVAVLGAYLGRGTENPADKTASAVLCAITAILTVWAFMV